MSQAEDAEYKRVSLTRTYGLAVVLTLAILIGGTVANGAEALLSLAALGVLGLTLSFDNAVVNSALLKRMSAFWQFIFMSVGILFAVFFVRFILPVLIVSFTSGLSIINGVINLALHDPTVYHEYLLKAGPLINAFGGTFLLLIGIGYFLDAEKSVHWLGWLERRLAPLGRYDNVPIFVMLVAAIVMFFTVPGDFKERATVVVATVCALALRVGLDLLDSIVDGDEETGEQEDNEEDPASFPRLSEGPTQKRVNVAVGLAAFVLFLRLEFLDMTYSFDDMVGSFAITKSVILIMLGLAIGALWVRSMTVHMVKTDTLGKVRYLEMGAMWSIFVLGCVMIAGIYKVEFPEWFTGAIGLVLVGLAVVSSVAAKRREDRTATTVEARETLPVA